MNSHPSILKHEFLLQDLENYSANEGKHIIREEYAADLQTWINVDWTKKIVNSIIDIFMKNYLLN